MPKKIKKDKYIKFCPHCHSKNVGTDTSNPALLNSGLFANANVCFDCGHSANFFPEIQKNKKLSKRKLSEKSKKELINTSYGKNILWWWRITSPIWAILVVSLIIFSKEKIFFQLGLIGFLPITTMFLIVAYRNDLIQKYKILKALFVLLLFYTLLMWAFYFVPRLL